MSRRRLVKIKLIGELGRRFGRCHEFMASSPREVISALSNQLDGFKDYLSTAHKNGIFFRLVSEDAEGMSYEECLMPCDQLIIAPIVTGSGGSGSGGALGRILLGVALIGLAFTGIGGLAIGLGAAGKITAGSILFSLGGALVFGGIAELLTPSPKEPDEGGSRSFLFDRAAELTTQGFPVPLLYGQFLAASPLIVSSAISTEGAPV